MIKSLIGKLKEVKDFRNPKGKKHELWIILLLIIVGIMFIFTTYRGLGDFVKNNQEPLRKILKIDQKNLPSYSTIRRTLEGVNWENLLTIFNEWGGTLSSEAVETEWLSLDGKSARNTLINYQQNQQNFLVFASVFSQETHLVLQLKRWKNK
jgi:DDE_Tnp_1-associated